jgi:nucleoside-diphosphate-sugar epimerase
MTRVLVVGGSGFIGTRLSTRLLELGHDVTIFDKAPSALHASRLMVGDVRDEGALRAAADGVDCIVGLAAEHRDDVRPASLYQDVNVGGAANLVGAAAHADVRRIVFVSSVAVYGLAQPHATEAAPLRPANEYGRSKAAAERVHQRWAEAAADRSLLVLRPVVVFGEGNRGNVQLLAEQIRRGRFAMVGSGRNRKGMAYVGNLVEFIARHLHGAPGWRVLNYADGPDFSSGELVARLCALLGRAPPAWRLPYLPALAGGYAFDGLSALLRRPLPVSSARVRKFCATTTVSTAALEATGFVRPYTLDDGLARMLAQRCPDAAQG